ncbi:hypothetical protein LINGRAHAP2_LOCUS11972 [Linum grandiflorum]
MGKVHQHSVVVDQIHKLMKKEWMIEILHVYFECNYTADYLASIYVFYPIFRNKWSKW